jgi:dsDNA-specific endonuclease/ATPase MutS2
VQTPFGKGVVREVRNNGRLLVEVQGRALVVSETDAATPDSRERPPRRARTREAGPVSHPQPRAQSPRSAEIDLHGLTVEEALARVDRALNDALLSDLPELRIIHGRSGGRIRGALHRRLQELPSVRGFRLDPRNAGVTIVEL